MKLYVASSWRNANQPAIVAWLREAGHEVYDFRHPPGGEHLGFSWSEVDRDWVSWSPEQYREGLEHPIAVAGFESDFGAMQWAEGCVLVLPCGRSAHLEAGWFVGADKPLWILLDPAEFGVNAGHHVTELMYRMATEVCTGLDEVIDGIALHERNESIRDVAGACNHDESPPECFADAQSLAAAYNERVRGAVPEGLRALSDAATPGKWAATGWHVFVGAGMSKTDVLQAVPDDNHADPRFAVASVNYVRDLLEGVTR